MNERSVSDHHCFARLLFILLLVLFLTELLSCQQLAWLETESFGKDLDAGPGKGLEHFP